MGISTSPGPSWTEGAIKRSPPTPSGKLPGMGGPLGMGLDSTLLVLITRVAPAVNIPPRTYVLGPGVGLSPLDLLSSSGKMATAATMKFTASPN